MALENPALNQETFNRGIAQATSRAGVSVTGIYLITALLLVLLVVAAAFGWSQVEIATVQGREMALQPRWTWLVFLLVFVLGLVGAFAFRAAPLVAPLYALGQGLLLGIVSRYYDLEFDGIVAQAVLATLAVFTATLLLYLTRIVKVTQGFVRGLAVAMSGLLLLYFMGWMLSLFGATPRFLYAPTPLGIALSVGIVILGALNLLVDFDFVERLSSTEAPGYMQWYAAFGLMLSIIWLYVSILRLLALLARAQR